MLSRYVYFILRPSKITFVVVKIHTYPLHLHVLGETHTYPCLDSRLCHTSKGHHVAHDL